MMDLNTWFQCPNEKCGKTLNISKVTFWEIVMNCPKCNIRVILKRYINGPFKSIFAQHSELSEKQREFLK